MTGSDATSLNLAELMKEPLDWRYKGVPAIDGPLVLQQVGGIGWRALEGDLDPPILILKESALQFNIELMADYCARHNVSLAPHAKTPVSPQIAARQLAAGAWAITVATFHQARVFRHFGAGRIFFANQLIERGPLRWVAEQLTQDPSFGFFCLVDSAAGVNLMEQHLSDVGFDGGLNVLIELGASGGRCGCRSLEEATLIADRIGSARHLRLVGVETYENTFPGESEATTISLVDSLLDRVRALITRLDTEGQLSSAGEFIVTAGGSLYFDRVVARLGGDWNLSRPVRVVLRCGSYVTQDDGVYKALSPLAGRATGEPRLRQALELWALVLSRPEPELAILGFGKRDAAHDRGLPIPFSMLGNNGLRPLLDQEVTVLTLNDHHARVHVSASSDLQVGDMVGMHISHPCTSFDKFRLIPIVDDDYRVRDEIRSYL
jgi:D-serine dehydratase